MFKKVLDLKIFILFCFVFILFCFVLMQLLYCFLFFLAFFIVSWHALSSTQRLKKSFNWCVLRRKVKYFFFLSKLNLLRAFSYAVITFPLLFLFSLIFLLFSSFAQLIKKKPKVTNKRIFLLIEKKSWSKLSFSLCTSDLNSNFAQPDRVLAVEFANCASIYIMDLLEWTKLHERLVFLGENKQPQPKRIKKLKNKKNSIWKLV